jgi:hypothetical protein
MVTRLLWTVLPFLIPAEIELWRVEEEGVDGVFICKQVFICRGRILGFGVRTAGNGIGYVRTV